MEKVPSLTDELNFNNEKSITKVLEKGGNIFEFSQKFLLKFSLLRKDNM